MSLKAESCGVSDVGCVRPNNEDVWAEFPELGLYIVADGMGGHRAGEVAAKEAVDAMGNLAISRFEHNSLAEHSVDEIKKFFEDSIELINSIVYSISSSDSNLKGMGTTLVCFAHHPDALILAHVGDSRAYRLRGGILTQLTDDDTLAYQLIDQGHLDPEDEAFFAYKNVITKAIGNGEELNPHVQDIEPQDGDVYLLCTDGLTDMLSHSQIEIILSSEQSVDELAADLVDLAKSLGGHDNVTALVIRLKDEDLPR